MAEEGQNNPNQQSDEAQPAAYTTNANSADTNQQTDEGQNTAQTPAATDDKSAATEEEAHQTTPDTDATDEPEIAANNVQEGWTPTDHETNFTTVGTNSDKQCLFIANLDDSTTEEELLSLFGLDTTPDTRKWSSAEITQR